MPVFFFVKLLSGGIEQSSPEGGVDLGVEDAGRTVPGTIGHGTGVVGEHPREGEQRSVYNI